jgi:hypothetical protein
MRMHLRWQEFYQTKEMVAPAGEDQESNLLCEKCEKTVARSQRGSV